jgi:CubicO group peptidase (beta-lactamase class C family)
MVEGRLRPVAALVDRIVRNDEVAGAGVAVLAGGEVALEHYAGEAAPGAVAGAETLWPLASISKLYTATLLMRLIEQGELTLNTRVHCLLPRFTGAARTRSPCASC